MKSKTIWIIVVVVVIIAILAWGYKTNWWGMNKTTANMTTAASRTFAASTAPLGSRWMQVPNVGMTCPEGATFGSELGLSAPDDKKCYIQSSSTK